MAAALRDLEGVGRVLVAKTTEAGVPTWAITFAENAGDLPMMEAVSTGLPSGVRAVVRQARAGTSLPLDGQFTLSLFGETTQALSATATADEVEGALENLDAISNVTVLRYGFLNDGSVLGITFSLPYGDHPVLSIDASGLTGSGLTTDVTVDVPGNVLGGVFDISNGSRVAEPLSFNASAEDMRLALEVRQWVIGA